MKELTSANIEISATTLLTLTQKYIYSLPLITGKKLFPYVSISAG